MHLYILADNSLIMEANNWYIGQYTAFLNININISEPETKGKK